MLYEIIYNVVLCFYVIVMLYMLFVFDSVYKEKLFCIVSIIYCCGSYGDGNLSEVVEMMGLGFNSGVRWCEVVL